VAVALAGRRRIGVVAVVLAGWRRGGVVAVVLAAVTGVGALDGGEDEDGAIGRATPEPQPARPTARARATMVRRTSGA
jgi:hypothetical protein